MSKIIGIDLGTTNSVAAIHEGAIKEILNKEGETSTRSAVGFYKSNYIIGTPAINVMERNPENTIISIKRLMGRAYSDPEVSKVKENYIYRIKSPESGDENDIRVVLGGKEYSPIEISSMILKKIKDDAEEQYNDKVEYATITVPAYFTDRQIEATRLAGELAGFKVQMIIDEPTAAAVAYSVDNIGDDEAKTIVVFDLGGGTFDISVLTIAGGITAKLNTEGDMWLGGDDFDHLIMDYVIDYIKNEFDVDGRIDNRFMVSLKSAAEKAKIMLTSSKKTDIILTGLLKDSENNLIDIDLELTLEKFEKMIDEDIKKCIQLVKKALKGAEVTEDQVDHILLVGGSSLIPKVQRALIDTFGENKILKNVNPMKCVAFGAAILANRIGENIKCSACGTMNEGNAKKCEKCGKSLEKEKMEKDGVIGNSPMPYGIQTQGDVFVTIIPKNSPQDSSKVYVQQFKVPRANLRRIKVPVYAGDNEIASKNDLQSTFYLELPKGTPEDTGLNVSFTLNDNGNILYRIKLLDGSGIEKEGLIDYGLNIGNEKKNDRLQYESKLDKIKSKIDNNRSAISEDEYTDLDDLYQTAIDELDNDINKAKKKIDELENKINTIINTAPEPWENIADSRINDVEYVLDSFGKHIEPDVTYKLKNKQQELKKARSESNKEKCESLSIELFELLYKGLGIISDVIFLEFFPRIAENNGRNGDAAKIRAYLNEIYSALKCGDYKTTRDKLNAAYEIVDTLKFTPPDEKDTDVLKHQSFHSSSKN